MDGNKDIKISLDFKFKIKNLG